MMSVTLGGCESFLGEVKFKLRPKGWRPECKRKDGEAERDGEYVQRAGEAGAWRWGDHMLVCVAVAINMDSR